MNMQATCIFWVTVTAHVCRPLTNRKQTVWHVPFLLRTSDEWLSRPQFSELDFIGQFHESWHTTVWLLAPL